MLIFPLIFRGNGPRAIPEIDPSCHSPRFSLLDDIIAAVKTTLKFIYQDLQLTLNFSRTTGVSNSASLNGSRKTTTQI